ncbi:hypothetical protein CEXT_184281 [Caerostris extrusa]|uniref:Uncharacterized protein n=1 Tax=Caerostris extrusa TaxID=172846 RepID=A0AAV4MIN0_CAEEX|nr:hypothetical protein CEXT_184281 [Caerostris extrusa]
MKKFSQAINGGYLSLKDRKVTPSSLVVVEALRRSSLWFLKLERGKCKVSLFILGGCSSWKEWKEQTHSYHPWVEGAETPQAIHGGCSTFKMEKSVNPPRPSNKKGSNSPHIILGCSNSSRRKVRTLPYHLWWLFHFERVDGANSLHAILGCSTSKGWKVQTLSCHSCLSSRKGGRFKLSHAFLGCSKGRNVRIYWPSSSSSRKERCELSRVILWLFKLQEGANSSIAILGGCSSSRGRKG